MPVVLVERSFGRFRNPTKFPATEEVAFTKVQQGTIGEGIKWVRETRSWAPNSDSLSVKRGIVVEDLLYDPRQVDRSFEGNDINSRKVQRLVGVRNWRKPWVKKVPRWTPDQS